MDKPAAMHWTPIVQRLFQGIEDEARMRGAADPPANDAAGKGVDDKRHIDKALPRRHVGKIGYPEPIRLRCPELTFDMIQGAWRGFVADRRLDRCGGSGFLDSGIS
jgi:hypothetical protein